MKKIFITVILLFINIFSVFAIWIEQPIEMWSIKKTKEMIYLTKNKISYLEENIKNFAPQILKEKKLLLEKYKNDLYIYEVALKIKIEENRKQDLRIFYFKIIFLSLVFSLIFWIWYFFYKNR